jgi:hypothetical protein
MLQCIRQDALLGGNLCLGAQVLETATATAPEMRADRINAPLSCRRRRSSRRKRTVSPGNAPSIKVAFPSMRATPRAS